MTKPEPFIHPDAKIGDKVTVDAFAYIAGDVEIGENCWIGPNVTIMDGARIGKNCRIFPGAVISAEPQDLKFSGEKSTVVIGDDCIIRECVTINRGTALDRGETTIGENTVLMAYTHVAHDCLIGDHVILANSVQLAGHIHIGDHAFLGGAVAVHQFVKIGAHVMISGGSMVRKDVPPYVTAAREPLSYAGINATGLRRKGFNNEQIREIQDIYRIFYLSGLNNTEAIEKIRLEQYPTNERDEILNFIESSNRGIMRGGVE